MNNRNFATINELIEFKQNLQLTSNLLFPQYLSKIYSNLLKREEICHHSYSIKIKRNSQHLKTNNIMIPTIKNQVNRNYANPRQKIIDRGISLKTFMEYFDVQEFIGERIFKYFNKSKTNKINKNDFCKGLNDLYYGDVKNLVKFTFFLADFNNDGMMYKSDMKLLLAYIPSHTEFSQKLCLKQIREIVNNFFKEKIDKPKEGDEKEIDFNIFSKYIEEYNEKNNSSNNNIELLQDYNNNAPFFYYISILSYLFKNCPFSPKNVDNFIYSKNKIKIKLRNERRSLSQKKILSTSIKKNYSNSMLNSTGTENKLENSSNGLFTVEKNNKNKLLESVKSIGQKNLFNLKKSSSQINIKRDSMKNFSNLSMILNKKKEDKKMNIFPLINSKEKKIPKNIFNKVSKKKKHTLSPVGHDMKTSSPIINPQNPDINKMTASPELVQVKNIFNLSNSNETNGSSNHSGSNQNLMKIHSDPKLPYILNTKDAKMFPLSVETKLKNEKDLADDPGEFVLCEYGSDEDSLNKNSSKNLEIFDEESQIDSNEVYLFKYNEDEFQNILTKYYAKLSEKEILFFSSDLKNNLCDLWFIYKSFVSTGNERVNNTNYFTINLTFYNNNVSKLYFLNEQICQNFSKHIKNSIQSFNFEDHYEMLEKLGHGHFGKVNKCKNKSSGQIFAVKVINKLDIKLIDLELIDQEKNYLKLIKHPNILSLKDYYEDRKNIYIIAECCIGGDLLNYIDERNKEKVQISEKTAAKITKKIAEGIRYLNFFGVIHRDIKPENIMFVDKNDINSLKIIDLGVSQTLTYGEMANEPIGTNGYICPEIYMHHNYSFKIDIWSLGIILYLMITGGILPFDDDKLDDKVIGKKVVYLQQEYPEEYFGRSSKGLISLLDRMLDKNDQKRININDLIKDSWFGIIKK